MSNQSAKVLANLAMTFSIRPKGTVSKPSFFGIAVVPTRNGFTVRQDGESVLSNHRPRVTGQSGNLVPRFRNKDIHFDTVRVDNRIRRDPKPNGLRLTAPKLGSA